MSHNLPIWRKKSRCEVTVTPSKQLQRTVGDKVPRHMGQRAAAELRR